MRTRLRGDGTCGLCERPVSPVHPWALLCDECRLSANHLNSIGVANVGRRNTSGIPHHTGTPEEKRLYEREYYRRVRRFNAEYMAANAARTRHNEARRSAGKAAGAGLPILRSDPRTLRELRQAGLHVVTVLDLFYRFPPGTDRRDALHDCVLRQLEAESCGLGW